MVAIYSTFLQRAYDQLIHDVALQNLPVVFALDRAGLVGADGATHAGAYDIAYLRCIPNMSVACPADENECRQLLTTRLRAEPSGGGALSARRGRRRRDRSRAWTPLPFGKGESRGAQGARRIAILAFGTLLYPALQAAEALDATVVNMRWAKPLDIELLLQVAAAHEALVTVEEGAVMGGAGSAVAEALARRRRRASRCCNWACPTSSSSMATRPSCWRCRGWMRRASKPSVRERFGDLVATHAACAQGRRLRRIRTARTLAVLKAYA